MSDLLEGLAFGLLLQISIGPVFIAVLHKAITQGFRLAWAMVWGVLLIDSLYILLSVLGVSVLLQNETALTVVSIAGALLLIWFGVRYLRAPAGFEQVDKGTTGMNTGGSLLKSFVFGIGLTLTNPLTILFWGAVLGSMMATQTFDGPNGVLLFAMGCVAATLFFLTAAAALGHLLERVLNERLSLWLNRAVGLFLIVFAVKLLLDAFQQV